MPSTRFSKSRAGHHALLTSFASSSDLSNDAFTSRAKRVQFAYMKFLREDQSFDACALQPPPGWHFSARIRQMRVADSREQTNSAALDSNFEPAQDLARVSQ